MINDFEEGRIVGSELYEIENEYYQELYESGIMCPSPGRLLLYKDRLLPDNEWFIIDDHIKTCSMCRSIMYEPAKFIRPSEEELRKTNNKTKEETKGIKGKRILKDNKNIRKNKINIRDSENT